LGNDGGGRRGMTPPPNQKVPKLTGQDLPPALAEYADLLLLGTGLDAALALLIATGQLDPPVQLTGLVSALRAGWLAEDPA
jgi:hypothetical protein